MTARRLGVALAMLSGFAGLALQGEVSALGAGLAAVISVLAPAVRRHLTRVPWAALTGLVVVALIGGLVLGRAPSAMLGGLLAYLQVHRRLSRQDESDDRVSLLLAALMLVASAGVTTDPLFLPVGLAWAWSLPLALLPEGAVRARGALVTSVVSGGVGLALFLIAPRPGSGDLGSGDTVELTGFSPDVELGAMDELLEDPGVVFRASVTPDPQGPIYWRGIALDWFDGQRWRSTTPPVPAQLQAPAKYPGDAVGIEIVLEPTPEGVLFTAGRPLSLTADGTRLRADAQGGWFAEASGRVAYSMMVMPPLSSGEPLLPPEGDRGALDRALRLPGGLDPRVRDLAADFAGEGSPREQVERIVAELRDRYSYTRRPADHDAEEPLTAFLFDTRAGHCEYFASALALLARTRGIPARVVNGFVGGERNPANGWWIVRRYHAHSWVEVHLPGEGWVLMDATPGPGAPVSAPSVVASWRDALQTWWVDGFLAYDRGDQTRAVVSAGRTAEAWLPQAPSASQVPWRGLVLLGVLWVVLAVVLRIVGRRAVARLLGGGEQPTSGPLARVHRRAREHVASMGIRVPPGMPPVEAAEHVRSLRPGAPADALVELAWLYYEVQLGGADPRVALPRARALLARVRLLGPAQEVTPAA